MRRREFMALAGAAAAWPLAARAQQAPIHRLGFLRDGPPPPSFMEGFRRGLREFGYVEDQNITIHYGLADGPEKLAEAAAELVDLNVDIIIASGTPPVVAAKNATKTIPIVYVASIDPIATGLVASLARPEWQFSAIPPSTPCNSQRRRPRREVLGSDPKPSKCTSNRIPRKCEAVTASRSRWKLQEPSTSKPVSSYRLPA
jgi:hypothetical protein